MPGSVPSFKSPMSSSPWESPRHSEMSSTGRSPPAKYRAHALCTMYLSATGSLGMHASGANFLAYALHHGSAALCPIQMVHMSFKSYIN
jgi:hypothetical protein